VFATESVLADGGWRADGIMSSFITEMNSFFCGFWWISKFWQINEWWINENEPVCCSWHLLAVAKEYDLGVHQGRF